MRYEPRKYYQFYDGKRFFIKYYTEAEAEFAVKAEGWKIVSIKSAQHC